MSLKERIYSMLVVSCSEKFNTAFAELLPPSKYQPTYIATSANEAKRCLAERAFDFVVLNLPLPDESGIRFAIDCCRCPTTVVLVLAKNDVYSEIYDKIVDHGIFAVPKPTSRAVLTHALSWMASARERLRKLEQKTLSIEERMEEIRIVNRAKCLLISELKMAEPDAHHYIEKYAMDNCISKRDAAQNIIKIYS
jgi:AmiR/NasT family two-component response regulator